MSIQFRDLSTEDAAAAGYLRVGYVVLRNPPTDILTNRVSSKERISVLRGSNDLVKMNGKGRWDVTVRWTAMLDDTATGDARYAQWEDVRTMVAFFKAAPFIEVENSYIRQCICEQDASFANGMRMGFGLRQLRISTHNDIVDALDCALTMTWFNYFPYSKDFAYLGGDDQSTDADRSDMFKSYIELWKSRNLDSVKDFAADGPSTIRYERQTPGTVKIRWREYKTFKINPAVVTNIIPSAAQALSVASVVGQSAIAIAEAAIPVAQAVGKKINVPPAIVFAQWAHETGGFKNRGARQLNNLAGINVPGGSGTDYRTFDSLDDFGNYYAGLIRKHYTPAVGTSTIEQFASALKAGHYFTDSLSNYIHGMSSFAASYLQYVALASTLPSQAELVDKHAQSQPGLSQAAKTQPTASAVKPAAHATSLSTGTDLDNLVKSMSADDQATIQTMLQSGWTPDFNTNDLMYFYLTHEMHLADTEHGDQAGDSDAPISLHPQQFSVLMVNNLAQIPLASYVYPTYQHVGSPSSEVSIGFLSIGQRISEEGEPIHTGISLLGGVIAFLEAQYLAYRTNWRRVDSVHRMQAVYVENQILNMLGIRGLTLDNLSSETVPDTSDLSQVELAGKQYENIFEDIGAFRIRTVSGTAETVSQQIVNAGTLSGLDQSEKQVIPTLTAFSQGRSASDIATLSAFLLQLGAQKTNIFSSFSSTPNMSPSGQQSSDMLATVTSASASDSSMKLNAVLLGISAGLSGVSPTLSTTVPSSFDHIVQHNRNRYPAIAARLDGVKTSGSWTAGDICLAQALATDSGLAAYKISPSDVAIKQAAGTAAAGLLKSQTAAVQSVYDAIYTLLANTDSSFANEIGNLSNSRNFADQFNSAFDMRGPALSADNLDTGNRSAHTAYRDLGLETLTFMGVDNNPGCYFVDHSKEYDQETYNQLSQVVGGAKETAALVNRSTTANEYYMQTDSTDFSGLKCDADSLMRSVHIPGLSMAEAFPTFKLFIMEDEAPGIINCFDNFYSYASVAEMEIIRYQDKPDVAVIQITNIANLLMHHLYDDTLMGRYEYSLNPFENPVPASGPVMGQEGALIVGKNIFGQTYQYLNASDGGMRTDAKARIPLQYVALQPGTKIQIRMGFANNADLLTPVFTGRATNISSEGDMLVITAESFLGELCLLPEFSGQPLKEQNFGSELFIPQSSDVASLVEYFLRTDSAKHLGAFKLATAGDQLLTGFNWTNRIGRAVGEFSLSPTNVLAKIDAAMAASYDRTAENIMVNHVVDYSGTAQKTSPGPGIASRSFTDSSSSAWFSKFSYHVKKNSTFTAWDLIRDISRRYPELTLTCKQYGFPYSADATLVLAHPLDWYYARPPLIGDVETYRTGQTATNNWSTWWQQYGKGLWASMISNIASIEGGALNGYSENTVREMLQPIGGTSIAGYWTGAGVTDPANPEDMYERMVACLQRLNSLSGQDAGSLNPGAFASALYAANVGLDNIIKTGESWLNILVGGGNLVALKNSKLTQAREATDSVRKSWESYLQQKVAARGGSSTAYDRLKPVRRYHFIDSNTIVHNGMRVNDKIYNGVRIAEHTVMANGHIPPEHRRILDVTAILNDPDNNLKQEGQWTAVAQSYLRDEVGKMYDGEIVLRGTPEIEPTDCLILLDPSTAISGIVEVGKVIHSFSLENGFITIVYPRALVAINEAASAGVARMFSMVMAKVWFTKNGLSPSGGFGQNWNSADSVQKGTIIVGAAGATAATAGLIALAGTPVGWGAALLGSALVWGGLLVGYKNESQNQIQILPVNRYARPWIGGLEGYQISDMWQNLGSSFKGWEKDNVFPLIQMYRNIATATSITVPNQP